MKTSMKAKFLLSLVGGALSLFSLTASAATLTVTTTADTADGVCNANCSLRDAIDDAANGDTIQFAVTGTIALTDQVDLGDKDLVIQGPGVSLLTLDGQDANRIFITSAGTVSISGLTMTRAANSAVYSVGTGVTFNLSDVVISDSHSGDRGGAIYNEGTVNIADSVITGNTNTSGNKAGGAIFNRGTLNISDSSVTDNFSVPGNGMGGAIFNNGTLTVERTAFTGNVAGHAGGAIMNDVGNVFSANGAPIAHGRLRVTDSTFFGNSTNGGGGGGGGAIFNIYSGDAQVAGSTFDSNFGGSSCCGQGGAIHNSSAGMHVSNSTFVNNVAANGGGAFQQFNFGSTIVNSTFVNNHTIAGSGGGPNSTAATAIRNSVIVGNTKGASVPSDIEGGASVSYSLIGDAATAGGAINGVNGNKVGYSVGAVVSTALANNGNPAPATQTLALLPGSPAIDAASAALALDAASVPLAFDQRGVGYARLTGLGVDMGAFEFGSSPIPPLDHYLGYSAKTPKSGPFSPLGVQLNSLFSYGTFRVEKPVMLLNPTEKEHDEDLTEIAAEDFHLVAYKLTPRAAAFEPITAVLVANQFGEATLDLRRQADLLLVPSTKSLEGPAPEDEDIFENDRHFLCYAVSEPLSLGSVALRDQFNESFRSFTPVRASRLCVPVEKTLLDGDGEPIGETTVGNLESEDALVCYTLTGQQRGRPAIRQPWTANQFGALRLITTREMQLCVPSTLDLGQQPS